MKGGVYCILNLENGRHYIGSAKSFAIRWANHRSRLKAGGHHSVILQRAWLKHGEDAFRFDIMEVVERAEDLVPREQWWLDQTLPFYNICRIAASCLGRQHSPETRKKIGDAQRGRKVPQEQIARMRERMIGRSPSQASREASSKRFKGCQLSDEHKAKIGDAMRGRKRVFSAEHCRRISEAKRKRDAEKRPPL